MFKTGGFKTGDSKPPQGGRNRPWQTSPWAARLQRIERTSVL